METKEMTKEELKAEKKSIRVGGDITVEENNNRWDRVFEIERELKSRGELEFGTYNED